MKSELEWTANVGAIHHARWMAAAIYVLKMLLCGEGRVQMGQRQFKGLVDLAYFILYVYGRYWFAAPATAADAPFLTLSLCKDLHKWSLRDPQLSAKLLRILDRHTWYLSPRNVFYALFLRMVENSAKEKIVAKMLLPENAPCELPPGKPTLPPISPETHLEDLVDSETWNLCRVRIIQISHFVK